MCLIHEGVWLSGCPREGVGGAAGRKTLSGGETLEGSGARQLIGSGPEFGVPGMDAAEASNEWHDVADDVRAWIEATKTPKSHCRWANQVRRRTVEHWREIIAHDAEYQVTLGTAVRPTTDERAPQASETPGTSLQSEHANATPTPSTPPPVPEPTVAKRKRKRAVVASDSFAAVQKKQRESNESSAILDARKSAPSWTAVLPPAAAQEVGAKVSAHLGASERLSKNGMGSIRSSCKPSREAELSLPDRHKDIYAAAMERAGIHEVNSNPLGLYDGMSAEDIHKAIQQSNPQTAVTFGPLSMASSSLGMYTFRNISVDSLDAMSSAVDPIDHFRAMQEVLKTR